MADALACTQNGDADGDGGWGSPWPGHWLNLASVTEMSDELRAGWTAAFPESVRHEVLAAVDILPASAFESGVLIVTGTAGEVRTATGRDVMVAGDPIRIPVRMYHQPLLPETLSFDVPPEQRIILACIYSRHYDGFERQRSAGHLARAEQPWVVPYVVQLLGEYVIEIIEEIEGPLLEILSGQAVESYARFAQDNQDFLDLTMARAASYWNCYYRGRYPSFRNYPARGLIQAIQRAGRSASASPR